MLRFSVRTLMALVLGTAIGFAALRNANEFWGGLMVLAAVGSFGAAVLGAIILRGQERFSCAGFAFFGIGYLLIALDPDSTLRTSRAWPRLSYWTNFKA
jgi:hypothetical protein